MATKARQMTPKPTTPQAAPTAAPASGKIDCCRPIAAWPLSAALVLVVLLVSIFTVLNCYELGLMKGREQLLAKKVVELETRVADTKAAADTSQAEIVTQQSAERVAGVSFSLPSGTVKLSDGRYDLGTAVTDPAADYKPSRTLEVKTVDSASIDAAGCYTGGWDAKAAGPLVSESSVSYGGLTFCKFTGTDAGAGNRYALNYYTLNDGGKYTVFAFVAHYVSCETGGISAPKCVEYDEARDAAVYPTILETVKLQ